MFTEEAIFKQRHWPGTPASHAPAYGCEKQRKYTEKRKVVS